MGLREDSFRKEAASLPPPPPTLEPVDTAVAEVVLNAASMCGVWSVVA